MEFEDRNKREIQRMVDLILETATNGLAWGRARESERLDHEEDSGDPPFRHYRTAQLPRWWIVIENLKRLQSESISSFHV
jgi:hypothetical protein